MVTQTRRKGTWNMLGVDKIRKFLTAAVSLVERRRSSRFTCGDCDRNAQCGLPPHDDCVFRLTQMAQDGDRPSRPYNYFYPAAWPHTGVRDEISRN